MSYIGVRVISNDPNEDPKKVEAALREEINAIAHSVAMMHGHEFADFAVPLALLTMNVAQLMGDAFRHETSENRMDAHAHAFAHQTLEIVLNRGIAFVRNNPGHKTIRTVPEFVNIFQKEGEVITSKIEEYLVGKKV